LLKHFPRRAPCAAVATPPMDDAVEQKVQHEARIRELTAERDD
jgi:hypothetical protein